MSFFLSIVHCAVKYIETTAKLSSNVYRNRFFHFLKQRISSSPFRHVRGNIVQAFNNLASEKDVNYLMISNLLDFQFKSIYRD